jgi:exopolyphosphatase/guanosine-5'-triphosphate,3'-diphosphate pyrophosphatase
MQSNGTAASAPPPIAALDIGTNSVRMALVRLDEASGTWGVLSQHKETVRLGQDEFASNRLSPEAMERGVLVLAKFAEIARGYNASEIIAIATAALREAENRDEFIERARREAGVEVHVVPGVEEARLIYLGVASGVELGTKKGLFIDIGGGSTELIIGTQTEHLLLESLKLGAIRLGNRFLSGVTGPVSSALYETLRLYVRGVATHALRKIREVGFDVAVASSGTAMNLAAIAARRAGQDPTTLRNYTLKASDLASVAEMLRKMTLEERRRVPGINPERADIIVSGAAVLQTLAEELRLDGLLLSDRSLREGIIVDSLLRRTASAENGAAPFEAGVRRRSIEGLARATESEREHAQHVTRLTLRLFDQLHVLGYHPYGPRERELLEYAALLHDVGIFVSHIGHHRHSYYLIRHSELAGFTDEEIEIVANLAYFHRKSMPKRRHAHFQALNRPTQRLVRRLAVLLRVAEGLDRSQLGLVQEVELSRNRPPERLTLTLVSDADPHLEVWYVSNESPIFEEVYGIPLEVRVRRPDAAGAPAPALAAAR